jgi:hypothetical protein
MESLIALILALAILISSIARLITNSGGASSFLLVDFD